MKKFLDYIKRTKKSDKKSNPDIYNGKISDLHNKTLIKNVNTELSQCNNENTKWLSLEGIVCECKVISIYDADTVTIALYWNNRFYKVKCRLLGIDSAEKRTKNQDEKKVSLNATKWLQNLILNKIIWVKCGKWGKYGGRMIGELYLNKKDIKTDISLNNLIVQNGFAYYYDGKKKKQFSEWYKHITSSK